MCSRDAWFLLSLINCHLSAVQKAAAWIIAKIPVGTRVTNHTKLGDFPRRRVKVHYFLN